MTTTEGQCTLVDVEVVEAILRWFKITVQLIGWNRQAE